MFCDYQINLRNTASLKSSLYCRGEKKGGGIQYFWEGGRTLYEENWHFIGALDNHLETMLYYFTLKSL